MHDATQARQIAKNEDKEEDFNAPEAQRAKISEA